MIGTEEITRSCDRGTQATMERKKDQNKNMEGTRNRRVTIKSREEQQQIEFLKSELRVVKSTLAQVVCDLKNLQEVFMSYPSPTLLSPDPRKTTSADTSNQMLSYASFPDLFNETLYPNGDLNALHL